MIQALIRNALIPVFVTIAVLSTGISSQALAKKETGKPYKAKVTWTSYGIPHVRASDWGGLGYGYGYAFAGDNLCTLALVQQETLAKGHKVMPALWQHDIADYLMNWRTEHD